MPVLTVICSKLPIHEALNKLNFFFFFDRQRRGKEFIKRNRALTGKPKAYRKYTTSTYRLKTKGRGIQKTYPPSSIAHPHKKVKKRIRPINNTTLGPRPQIANKRNFHHLDRKILIFKCNPISFPPNHPKKA